MKIGLQINRFTWPNEPQSIADIIMRIARTADEGGFYSLWVMDHFFQIMHIGPPEEPMLEGYTTLGFLSGVTKNIMLGTMVTGVIYRYPALLVKAVTTLDVLSKGRAYFGVGAAWNEEESKALGFDFPPLKTRFELLEDTLQLALQMWDNNAKPYKGKRLDIPHPINHPESIVKPHPPILIGGGGEKKTLRLVAKYANACNLFAAIGSSELDRKLDILKKHCEAVGRNYEEIEKTALYHVQPGFQPEKIIEDCKKLREKDITHLIISIRNVEEIEPIKIIAAEVIPKVSSL